jgi:C1A family cysteine protease
LFVKKFILPLSALLTAVASLVIAVTVNEASLNTELAERNADLVSRQQKPPVKKYARGLVSPSPEKLKVLHAEAYRRHDHRMKHLSKITAPAFDCRTLGIVPPVVDQGQCGSCWDFSGTGMVTSSLIKAGYGKNDGSFMLSEQYTLDCGRNGGCYGDDNTTVLAWAKATGLPTTAAYGPYQGSAGSCKYAASMTLYKIADWGYCTPAQQQGIANTQDIKNAMVQYGPIGTGVAADSNWDNYTTGIMPASGDTGVNHDVIIVGWDDNALGSGTGCWIMRNSWGTSWGMQGYAYVPYGSYSIGTEAVWSTANPLPPPPAPTPAPPGPNPPTPPGPGTVTTLQLSQPLAAGTYEIAAQGSDAAWQAVQAAVAARPVIGGHLAMPTTAEPPRTIINTVELERRITAMESSMSRLTDSMITLQKLIEGKAK